MPSKIVTPFGALLSRILERDALSLSELSRRIEVSKPAVWSYLNQGRLPSEEILARLLTETSLDEETARSAYRETMIARIESRAARQIEAL